MKRLHGITAAIALVAMPGAAWAAGAPVTPENQDAHYDSLFTAAATDCLDLDTLSGEEREAGCTKSLEEVKARRAAAVNPTVAERADYDFFESLMHIAMASAYFGIDGNPSARVCQSAERSWKLHQGLLSIPRSSFSPSMYDKIHDVPQSVGKVLSRCRKGYGTPDDAAPLPET